MSTPQHQDKLVYDIRDSRYINLTNSCTLKCAFCPKTQGTPFVHEYDLGIEEKHSLEEYLSRIGDPCRFKEIVFCGFGEPTLRLKFLLSIAKELKQSNAYIRINTDGLANLVHKRNVLPEMQPYIDALSISLNGQTEAVYNQHCQPGLKGSFAAALDFIQLAPQYIPSVTVTAIDGLVGLDIKACEKLALQRGAKFRRRVLDIVG